MLAPLPPPSGGIASWTVRYRDYCRSHGINLDIVNIAIQGTIRAKTPSKRSLKDEIKRSNYIIKKLKQGIKNKPDVIHLNTSCSPLGVFRDALCVYTVKNKIPIILHCRCNIEDQLGNNKLSRVFFRYIVNKSSKIIVLNKFSKKFVDSIEIGKTVCIPNFVNEKLLCQSHVIKEKVEQVIFVGHIEKAKGIVQISEVASLLPDITFFLLGEITEPLPDNLIKPNMKLLGCVQIDEVKDYLCKSDLFIFPSLTEGFSNALLEAMAVGLPVIASDVGANLEMIENQGGRIIPKNDSQALHNAIQSVSEKHIREAMSIWNIRKVKDAYLIEHIMNQYFKLYDGVVKG